MSVAAGSAAALAAKGSVAQKEGICSVKRQVGLGVKVPVCAVAVAAASGAAKLQMP